MIALWLKVAHLAQAFNLPVAPHAVQVASLHLACATPNLKSVEYVGLEEELFQIVFKEFPLPQDGMWSPDPDRPGWGLEMNTAAVEQYAISSRHILPNVFGSMSVIWTFAVAPVIIAEAAPHLTRATYPWYERTVGCSYAPRVCCT